MKQKLVSVAIPTFNNQDIITECLETVKKQTYRNIEIIVVDGFSSDDTPKIAKKYGKLYSFGRDPKQKNIFAVPHQRNYGAKMAKGEYIYYMDSDMRLTPRVIETCVKLIEKEKADAVIVPEEAYGEGFWAECRTLEKACYNATPNSNTDSARFVRKTVWEKLNGLDASLGGGDDWDFQHRLNLGGHKTVKSTVHALHYDGHHTLDKILRKEFVYGKNTFDYFRKYKNDKKYLFSQFSFLRKDFLLNFDKLLKDPIHAVGMFVMKIIEYIAVTAGMVYAFFNKERVKIYEKS